MISYLARRVGSSIVMMAIVSLVIFIVLRLLPGDPTVSRVGRADGVSEETLAALREDLGLAKPLLVQYFEWISGVLVGDFGISYFSSFPVSTLIDQRLPATLQLAGAGVLVAIVITVIFAVLPVLTGNRAISKAIDGFTTLGVAAPPFVIGILLIIIFSMGLGWLPANGYVAPSASPTEHLRRIVLPALTVGIVVAAPLIRYLHASIEEVRRTSYVRTALGKGLSWRDTVMKHIFPNALPPALTALAISVGAMLGGVAVVEIVFAWPGLGQQIVDAVFKRDYPVIQAIVLLAAFAFIITALLTDILYGALDPRLRVPRQRRGKVRA